MLSHIHSHLAAQSSSGNNIAFAALIWWVIPAGAVIGAIAYVLWVSKFQDKYSNETNRSVNNFNRFQASFRNPGPSAAPQPPTDSLNIHDPQ
jgi:hypothetical protein